MFVLVNEETDYVLMDVSNAPASAVRDFSRSYPWLIVRQVADDSAEAAVARSQTDYAGWPTT